MRRKRKERKANKTVMGNNKFYMWQTQSVTGQSHNRQSVPTMNKRKKKSNIRRARSCVAILVCALGYMDCTGWYKPCQLECVIDQVNPIRYIESLRDEAPIETCQYRVKWKRVWVMGNGGRGEGGWGVERGGGPNHLCQANKISHCFCPRNKVTQKILTINVPCKRNSFAQQVHPSCYLRSSLDKIPCSLHCLWSIHCHPRGFSLQKIFGLLVMPFPHEIGRHGAR